MKHRTLKTLAITSAFAAACAFSSFAGSWTHCDKAGFDWSNLWFYVKDNGQHAENEWIVDNGTWYWIDDSGCLGIAPGISTDGYLYNSQGIYVPINDGSHHFVDQAMYNQLHEGMSADQVNAILGQPHELDSSSSSDFGSSHFDYATYIWYSSNAKGSIYVHYTNGVVSFTSAYWY